MCSLLLCSIVLNRGVGVRADKAEILKRAGRIRNGDISVWRALVAKWNGGCGGEATALFWVQWTVERPLLGMYHSRRDGYLDGPLCGMSMNCGSHELNPEAMPLIKGFK